MGTDDLDDLSGVPRWSQIAAVVEREILAGVWPPGHVAPSRTVLMQRFGVAGETARHALTHLTQLGYLSGVPGVGMIVTPEARWPHGGSEQGLTVRGSRALQSTLSRSGYGS